MTRLTVRLCTAAAGLAACGLTLAGCSAGQISQTANQESAVNGTTAGANNIDLRNVHLQAVQTGDFLQPGSAVQLMFVAINRSPDVSDKLVRISSEVGAVTVTGNGAIPAGAALLVGSPDGQPSAVPMGSAEPTTAQVTLNKSITNGLTYNFTFDFEQAGRIAVAVPISAGSAERQ